MRSSVLDLLFESSSESEEACKKKQRLVEDISLDSDYNGAPQTRASADKAPAQQIPQFSGPTSTRKATAVKSMAKPPVVNPALEACAISSGTVMGPAPEQCPWLELLMSTGTNSTSTRNSGPSSAASSGPAPAGGIGPTSADGGDHSEAVLVTTSGDSLGENDPLSFGEAADIYSGYISRYERPYGTEHDLDLADAASQPVRVQARRISCLPQPVIRAVPGPIVLPSRYGVVYNHVVGIGWDNDVLKKCKAIIERILLHHAGTAFKIGITTEPETRYLKYKSLTAARWLVLLHRSDRDTAIFLEQGLIRAFLSMSACKNVNPGGEGAAYHSAIYTYVCVGGHLC